MQAAAILILILALPITLRPVDSLVKVFPDDDPADFAEPNAAHYARGETVSLQFILHPTMPLTNVRLSAQITPPPDPNAADANAPLPDITIRWLDYVPVDRPPAKPPADYPTHRTPGPWPDPLIPYAPRDLDPNHNQLVWLTIPIPADAPPGRYGVTLSVAAQTEPGPIKLTADADFVVHPVTVGKSRLWMTHWFRMTDKFMQTKAPPGSDAYWALLRRYADNMAAHRQNVALSSPLNLAKITQDPNGDLRFDFTTFDRWVQTFIDAGVIGRIEGGHIGTRRGGWTSQFVARIKQFDGETWQTRRVDPNSPAAIGFYRQFFPALVDHLRSRGWLDIYMQHLADEPIRSNVGTYRQLRALADLFAPELRIIEATHTHELAGVVDIWVPQLDYYHRGIDHYVARQAAGDEVWFYTCLYPQGEYANRFIDQPTLKTRILPWIAFRYGATGFLHWGYNQWTDNPFEKTTRDHHGNQYLPAGDAFVVYPGQSGPLDSVRWEALRDGIADYELLSMLAEKDAELAASLAQRFVAGLDAYQLNVDSFRANRATLLGSLSEGE